MGDLDQLRRRLWLAVLAGAVGCASEGTAAEAPPEAAAALTTAAPDAKPDAKPDEPQSDGLGMTSIIDAARLDAAAAEQARIEAAKPKVDAAAVCDIAVDKAEAVTGRLDPADEYGCPQQTSGAGSSKYAALMLAGAQTKTLRDGGDEDNCCYRRPRPPVRGRPYRVDGSLRLPEFRVGAPWPGRQTPSADARAAAAGWLRDAREELASVSAFERAAVELTHVSAPTSLVDACHVAAEQERRHAALCLQIAETLAGRALHLGRAPAVRPREPDLLQLLLHTFEEGCVGETIAAVVARRSAPGAAAPIEAVQLEIAQDETEHAALAWRTLAWGLPRLSAAQRQVFFERALEFVGTAVGRAGASEAVASHGRLPREAQAQIAADVCRRVVGPLLRDLALRTPKSTAASRHPLPVAVATIVS